MNESSPTLADLLLIIGDQQVQIRMLSARLTAYEQQTAPENEDVPGEPRSPGEAVTRRRDQ